MAGKKASPVIGIDLGTTYSCVACNVGGVVEIIANDEGVRTTPSYVAFAGNERLIGQAAKQQAAMNPKNTVYDIKRIMGRAFNDEVVQKEMASFPFKVPPPPLSPSPSPSHPPFLSCPLFWFLPPA